ncbi:MAG: hypothetical protein U0790_07095 [Isosphaeraceae bacterium]
MRVVQTTLGHVAMAVVFLAFGLAALREPTPLWDAAIFSLTVLALLASVLLTVHRTGSRRAYWLGFACVGVCYLALSIFPATADRLVTSRLLGWLDVTIEKGTFPSWTRAAGVTWLDQVSFSPDGKHMAGQRNGRVLLWDAGTGTPFGLFAGANEHFMNIGHCFVALLLAALGGSMSRLLRNRGPGEMREASPAPGAPPGRVDPGEETVRDPQLAVPR